MEDICVASEKSNTVIDDHVYIGSFLAGKNVFITGGTGFLGTVLIERLLAATPKIGKIYVLVRAKNGFTPESRIERLMSKVVSIANIQIMVLVLIMKTQNSWKKSSKALPGNIKKNETFRGQNILMMQVSRISGC